MRSYDIEAQVINDFVSPLNRYGYSSNRTLSLCTRLKLGDVKCRVELGERSRLMLHGLEAPSVEVAFDSAGILLDKLCIAATVAGELKNPNPHHGHLRLRWDTRSLVIVPADYPSDSLETTITEYVSAELLTAAAEALSGVNDASLICDAYYRAMGPQDPKTKYAVGFFVIELVEGHFTDRVATAPLLSGQLVRSILNQTKVFLRPRCPQDTIDRVVSHIGALASRTMETRIKKLTTILNSVFQITEVETGTEQLQVDSAMVKRLIETRNRLYHGGGFSGDTTEGFREVSLVLMGIIGQILAALLEGRVQWEETE